MLTFLDRIREAYGGVFTAEERIKQLKARRAG